MYGVSASVPATMCSACMAISGRRLRPPVQLSFRTPPQPAYLLLLKPPPLPSSCPPAPQPLRAAAARAPSLRATTGGTNAAGGSLPSRNSRIAAPICLFHGAPPPADATSGYPRETRRNNWSEGQSLTSVTCPAPGSPRAFSIFPVLLISWVSTVEEPRP